MDFIQLSESIYEVDGDILRSFIFKMISVKPDEVVFCIAGNKNYSDKEFSERRHEFEAKKPLATGTYKSEKYDKIMNYRVVIIWLFLGFNMFPLSSKRLFSLLDFP